MTAVLQTDLRQPERVDGAARIVFARRHGCTRLEDLYQRAPCRVLFPDTEVDDPAMAALLTTSGGLTGGDRLEVSVAVKDNATATITTQAAERIYRSNDGVSTINVALEVGAGAWVEWLMQETILFDGANLSRRIEADVSPTGRLLAVESLVFGRAAMGESFRRGYLLDRWRIRLGGRLAWLDALKLGGDVAGQRALPFGLGNSAGCATLIYAGADARSWIDAARAAIADGGAAGGASSFDGLLVARLYAGSASVLREAVARCVRRLRSEIAGLPSRMPRLWSI